MNIFMFIISYYAGSTLSPPITWMDTISLEPSGEKIWVNIDETINIKGSRLVVVNVTLLVHSKQTSRLNDICYVQNDKKKKNKLLFVKTTIWQIHIIILVFDSRTCYHSHPTPLYYYKYNMAGNGYANLDPLPSESSK